MSDDLRVHDARSGRGWKRRDAASRARVGVDDPPEFWRDGEEENGMRGWDFLIGAAGAESWPESASESAALSLWASDIDPLVIG